MSKASDILAAALRLAEQGWAEIPCYGIVDNRCSCGDPDCGSPGKHPRTPHGVKDATTDQAQIRAWWKEWPDANVGIATGLASGLLAIDVDGPKGEAALRALSLNLPATLEVKTGRGRHLYYAAPGGAPSKTFGPNLSIRGDGLYVIAPPSLHVSGNRYRWANGLTPIALAPTELLGLLNSSAVSVTASAADGTTPADGTIPDGTRKRTLLQMAMGMAREGHGRANIEEVLGDVNQRRCSPPLAPRDVKRVVAKAFD